jgi:hypothetical protein
LPDVLNFAPLVTLYPAVITHGMTLFWAKISSIVHLAACFSYLGSSPNHLFYFLFLIPSIALINSGVSSLPMIWLGHAIMPVTCG